MRLLLVALWLACFVTASAQRVIAGTLTPAGVIVLSGVRGRIDHLAIDHAGQRLFVAALGNNTLEVIDLAGGKVMRSIEGFDEPQGLAYAPDLNRLFVANGGDGTVRVLNAAYFGELASLPLGSDADNVRYSPANRQLLVGFGDGGLAIVDVTTNRTIGRVELPSHPESFQLDATAARVFTNVPGTRAVVVIDRASRRVSATWRLNNAGSNFPLAVDPSGKRLLVGCRSPAKLVILSTEDGAEIGTAPLHRDCDDVFYDADRGRVYATCGEGFIDVYATSPDRKLTRIDSIATPDGTRTCLFDADRLYVAVPKHGDAPAEIRVFRCE